MRRLLSPCALGLGLVATACGTDPDTFHVGCDQIEAVTVGAGLTPRISWKPDCRIASIAVYEATPAIPSEDPVPTLPGQGSTAVAGAKVWEVGASFEVGNLVSPSVRYGDVPGDVSELTPAQPLSAGRPRRLLHC